MNAFVDKFWAPLSKHYALMKKLIKLKVLYKGTILEYTVTYVST